MRNQAVRLGDTIKVMNTIIFISFPDPESDPDSSGSVDPDPDPGNTKLSPKQGKNKEISCF